MKPQTQKKPKKFRNSALETLTAAALILPGLLQAKAYAADDDEVDFQYSHYEEGKRDVYIDSGIQLGTPGQITKLTSGLNPIQVDSLNGKARVSLTDRVKLAFNYTQDTWGGATPIASAPAMSGAMNARNIQGTNTLAGASPVANDVRFNPFFIDQKGNIYAANQSYDPNTGAYSQTPGIKNNQLTHVMAMASPETRQQGDFKVNYAFDNASLSAGGGVSIEKDYDSRFGNLGIGLDFNEKRTHINWGLSYTNSDTNATLDPISAGYIAQGPYGSTDSTQTQTQVGNQITNISYSPQTQGTYTVQEKIGTMSGRPILMPAGWSVTGNRQDWGNTLGLTQVLTKNAELDLGVGYTHSAGYMTNPYKAVYVFDAVIAPGQDPTQPFLYYGGGQWESRPHERNQFNGNLGYHYYLEALDAGLHTGYSLFHDDWGITSHTFDGDWVQPLGAGWTVTPNVRYYSQSAANFYAPYFTTVQMMDPNTGLAVNSPLNKALPTYYSSDQRLSGFGALSGGVTVTKQFAKGIQLQTGFEYYTHQGGLKLGGGGEQAFADMNYWTANAALKINLGALRFNGGSSSSTAAHHAAHAILNPAGVMFDHALAKAGDYMVGYRYQRSEQAGSVLNGSSAVSPDQILQGGCPSYACEMMPTGSVMNMHMLDLMAAPTDWLTLMLMPQWMDMTMNMNDLPMPQVHGHSMANLNMLLTKQNSGGVGDTGLYALFKLFEQPGHHLVLSMGGTAPTGSVNQMIRQDSVKLGAQVPMDYSMQLGSGTWDLKPSLTYSGSLDEFTWGAQATGTKRLQSRNSAGYALGDIFQSSVWGGYHWLPWLSTTVRGIYTWQDQIQGGYPPIVHNAGYSLNYLDEPIVTKMPSAFTSNYGVRFVDVGLGLNVMIPGGPFAGSSLKFEWLQPVHTDYNGYQLDRSGALAATWGVGF